MGYCILARVPASRVAQDCSIRTPSLRLVPAPFPVASDSSVRERFLVRSDLLLVLHRIPITDTAILCRMDSNNAHELAANVYARGRILPGGIARPGFCMTVSSEVDCSQEEIFRVVRFFYDTCGHG